MMAHSDPEGARSPGTPEKQTRGPQAAREHTKGKRKSTREKHEEGQRKKTMGAEGEKGDKGRTRQRRKRRRPQEEKGE